MSTSEIAREVFAARASAGLVELSDRARLEVRGPDRQTWLQGMVTNDLAKLGPGQGCAATALNNKGKLLGSLLIWVRPDALWLDVEGVRKEALRAHLAHFIVMEDCEIRDATGALASLAVVGPKAWAVARAIFPSLSPLADHAQVELPSGAVAAGWTELGLPGVRLWVEPAKHGELWSALQAAGATALSPGAVEVLRIEAGRPREGAELDEEVIPLEAGLERAISDTKGCYLGQEVIARISHRGHVNRKLAGLTLSGAAPTLPAVLTREDKPAGELRSAAWSPTLERTVGLGYVRREWLAPGTALALPDGSSAVITELPFVKA